MLGDQHVGICIRISGYRISVSDIWSRNALSKDGMDAELNGLVPRCLCMTGVMYQYLDIGKSGHYHCIVIILYRQYRIWSRNALKLLKELTICDLLFNKQFLYWNLEVWRLSDVIILMNIV